MEYDKNSIRQDEKFSITAKSTIIKRLMEYISPYKKEVAVVMLLMVFTMAVSLLNPSFVQYTVDNAIAKKDFRGLILVSLGMLALNLLSAFAARVRLLKMGMISNKIVLNMREELYKHIQKLSFAFFDSRPVGKILARVVGDINSLQLLFTNSVTSLIPQILQLILVTIIMFLTNSYLAIATIIIMPILVSAIFIVEVKARVKWAQYRGKRSNLNAFTHETFSGMKVVQGFAKEKYKSSMHISFVEEMNGKFRDAIRLNDLFWPFVELSWGIGSAAVLFLGGLLYWKNMITIGELFAFTMFIGLFWRPVMFIANFYNTLITSISSAERIFEILDTKPDIVDLEGAEEMPEITGNIEFKDVTFEYEKNKPVLCNVSFKVDAGNSIALVGETGAGKTTIINLIARFYDVKSGKILIDGTDISKVRIESLRKQMGIMMQDTFLFSDTIRENIRYGKPDATDDEIIAAAKAVNAHEFIMKLENGYDTEVRERGSRLSVGQRQLISFARALLANPRILILDEATSNIDTQTERLVQDGISKLLKNRTSFVIAHRLSTIRDCDRILVVEGGGIKEAGTHDELLKLKGTYYDLYMAQYGFINEGA